MPVGELFIDSSAWFRYVMRGRSRDEDSEHTAVRGQIDRCVREHVPLCTTNLVVSETHQLLLLRADRALGLQFLRMLPIPRLDVVGSTPDLEERAVRNWIEPYDDHDFSLCDAVSFAVMKDRGIRQALALDRHFAAAGFEVLPGR